MSTDVIGYIIGGLAVVAAAVIAARSTNKANAIAKAASDAIQASRAQTDQSRVVGEAYDRAADINRQMVEDLTAELRRLQTEMTDLRTQLRTEEQNSAALRLKVRSMQDSIDRLAQILRTNNIAVPPTLAIAEGS